MTLTVRHRGQIVPLTGDSPAADVVALIWFDADSGPWGGTLDIPVGGEVIRQQVATGRTEFCLRLDDDRAGAVRLEFSAFDADGLPPLVFSGIDDLGRSDSC